MVKKHICYVLNRYRFILLETELSQDNSVFLFYKNLTKHFDLFFEKDSINNMKDCLADNASFHLRFSYMRCR